ncbi:hypothetical protein ACFW04_011913 [Cataglyphis niger]
MSETWLDKKEWDRSRGYIPKGFRWEVQLAKRKNKGRTMGGMLLGKRKGLEVEKVKTKKSEGLMEVALKVYASVLTNRLSNEVEKKGLVLQNQTGFRKGLGTMDNIFILNYLMNRQLGKKKDKLAFFIDLKAAFDSVNRRKLVEAMSERRVKEGLVRRSEDILRETRNRMRRGEDLGAGFWTGR